MNLFSSVQLAPKDPIFGLTEAYMADQNPEKVNLGVGVYYTDDGKVPLLKAVIEAESEIFALKTKISSIEQSTKLEIRKSQELQAQNEKAMNIALDQFSVKFEEQNKLVAGVREELSKKFADQLVFSGLAFLALLIVFVILTKASTNKAMKQNLANWNSFQEHILKK